MLVRDLLKVIILTMHHFSTAPLLISAVLQTGNATIIDVPVAWHIRPTSPLFGGSEKKPIPVH
jgi:hypothetical protein